MTDDKLREKFRWLRLKYENAAYIMGNDGDKPHYDKEADKACTILGDTAIGMTKIVDELIDERKLTSELIAADIKYDTALIGNKRAQLRVSVARRKAAIYAIKKARQDD